MSVHFRGKCYIVENVICEVESQTKWNKTQPRVVMRGFADTVVVNAETALIRNR